MKQYKLYLSILLLCCCVQATAQNALVPVDEETAKKKEINQIKRSEQAVYADIMEMASDDEEALSAAHQKSRDMLQAHVIEIFAKRMKMSKKDVQEIWDVIDDKCQNIVVKKGDLFRVFSYIMKDAIGLGPKKPKEGDVEKYMEKTATADSVATDPVVTDSVPIEVAHATQPKDSVVPAPIEPVQETTSTQPQEVQPQEELSKEEKPKRGTAAGRTTERGATAGRTATGRTAERGTAAATKRGNTRCSPTGSTTGRPCRHAADYSSRTCRRDSRQSKGNACPEFHKRAYPLSEHRKAESHLDIRQYAHDAKPGKMLHYHY